MQITTAWMRLGGTFGGFLVQHHCLKQDQLNQAAQRHVQLGFEYLQDRGSTTSLLYSHNLSTHSTILLPL